MRKSTTSSDLRRAVRGTAATLTVTALAGVAVLIASIRAEAFDFDSETSCIRLNACNSDLFSFPSDCIFSVDPWCNCLRTALERPLRGEASGVEQGIISVFGQPGIGNHRMEVLGGTLDLAGIAVGDVIGGTHIRELVPETVAPPGTFFTVRTELRVTAKGENWIEVDNVHVPASPTEDAFVEIVLRYDRFDADHSHGLQHRGRITALGDGEGFVFEYRYEAAEGATFAAIEPSDLSPGTFNVRLVVSLFTAAHPDGAGAFVLPDEGSLEVRSTIRKVADSGNGITNPDEILPLGAEDLCVVIDDLDPNDEIFPELEPCKVFEEELDLLEPGANRAPVASICATDVTLQPLVGDLVNMTCSVGRAILRGGESSDGDGGSQELTYLWEIIDEPFAGAASIPAETQTFRDVEVTFLEVGDYVLRLTVDDGQEQSSSDTDEILLRVEEGFGVNQPPEITRVSYLDSPGGDRVDILADGQLSPIEITIAGGVAEITGLEIEANPGLDECSDALSYLWSAVSGPEAVELSSPAGATTNVRFTEAGSYVLRVVVGDGEARNGETSLEIAVEVAVGGVGPLLHGDCNGDGALTGIADAIFLLGYNFLGTASPPCAAACDVNGDADIGSISDAVYLLSFSFLGGPPPTEPFESCAVSPLASDLELGCEDPSGCL